MGGWGFFGQFLEILAKRAIFFAVFPPFSQISRNWVGVRGWGGVFNFFLVKIIFLDSFKGALSLNAELFTPSKNSQYFFRYQYEREGTLSHLIVYSTLKWYFLRLILGILIISKARNRPLLMPKYTIKSQYSFCHPFQVFWHSKPHVFFL